MAALGEDGTRPVEKTGTGRGEGYIDPCVFFVKSEGWVSRVLDITYRRNIFCFLES